jgi:periplasmic divalent cation tolerance protein
MNSIVLLYVPLPDQKTGQMMAQRLLEKKLIACANIFSPHIAVYEWNGAVCDDPEVVTIFKTSKDKKDQAMAAIEELHPYETPAIIAIDSTDTNKTFYDWVNR